MHIHRYEKIWLTFGIGMLMVFLVVLGIGTFAQGMQPPSHHEPIDPSKVAETAPFDKPGLNQIGEKRFEAVMTAFVFGYEPSTIEVPAGSTVKFTVTSKDVVHGFQIPGTNVNAMIVPGQISQMEHKFSKPGEYLILCNEYCGAAHEFMAAKVIVK
jgi:cytochrome c oxidase subunit II